MRRRWPTCCSAELNNAAATAARKIDGDVTLQSTVSFHVVSFLWRARWCNGRPMNQNKRPPRGGGGGQFPRKSTRPGQKPAHSFPSRAESSNDAQFGGFSPCVPLLYHRALCTLATREQTNHTPLFCICAQCYYVVYHMPKAGTPSQGTQAPTVTAFFLNTRVCHFDAITILLQPYVRLSVKYIVHH